MRISLYLYNLIFTEISRPFSRPTISSDVAGEIQHRLDRLYLETVQKVHGVMQDETTQADSDVSEALEEELGSLYSEIGILAELSTRQQLVDPIHREIQSQHGALCASSNQKLHLVGRSSKNLAQLLIIFAARRHSFADGIDNERVYQRITGAGFVLRDT